jgi:hypothetical protein
VMEEAAEEAAVHMNPCASFLPLSRDTQHTSPVKTVDCGKPCQCRPDQKIWNSLWPAARQQFAWPHPVLPVIPGLEEAVEETATHMSPCVPFLPLSHRYTTHLSCLII